MMALTCVATGSQGNCYVLYDEGRLLILDCGQKVKWVDVQRACGFQMHMIDGVLYTHAHTDHFGHAKEFNYIGIDVFCGEEMAEGRKGLRILPERRRSLIEGGWAVVPWNVPHTDGNGLKCPCTAFYVVSPSGHSLVYITDFLYSPFTFKNLKAQTLLVACNHDDDIEFNSDSTKAIHTASGHSSLSTVKELVRVNATDDLKTVILCHLSRENADEIKMLREVASVTKEHVNVKLAKKHEVTIL